MTDKEKILKIEKRLMISYDSAQELLDEMDEKEEAGESFEDFEMEDIVRCEAIQDMVDGLMNIINR